jgi:hypothetical protein
MFAYTCSIWPGNLRTGRGQRGGRRDDCPLPDAQRPPDLHRRHGGHCVESPRRRTEGQPATAHALPQVHEPKLREAKGLDRKSHRKRVVRQLAAADIQPQYCSIVRIC